MLDDPVTRLFQQIRLPIILPEVMIVKVVVRVESFFSNRYLVPRLIVFSILVVVRYESSA